MIVVQTIHQEAGSHDIARREIRLHFGEIAESPDVVSVFTGWKFRTDNDDVVVFSIQAVVEPDSSLFQRSGKGESWVHFVEGQTLLVLNRRNEIRNREAIVIVTDAGLQSQNTGRAFSVLGGNAAGFHFDCTQRIGADPRQELSVCRLSHVESVEQDECLISLRAGNVWLSIGIEHDSGYEGESVAIVASVGIGNVEDIESAELFLRRHLRRINSGRRFDDIHCLFHFLLVRDPHLERP